MSYFKSLSGSEVGRTLWCVPFDSRMGKPFEVTITKVGRKYVHTTHDLSFSIEDAKHCDASGFGGRYALWPTKESHEQYLVLQDAWDELCHLVRTRGSRCPIGIGPDEIRTAINLLNLREK